MNTENTDPYKQPDSSLLGTNEQVTTSIRRKGLVPLWVKIFAWIFIVMGVFATVGFFASMFGFRSKFELYGITTYGDLGNIYSWLVFGLFIFSGVAAYGLLFAKDWAITVCMIVAYITLAVMLIVSAISLYYGTHKYRLEILVLIPYLLFLHRISADWSVEQNTS